MKVLQFAFDVNEAGKEGFTNPFLPHMYTPECVVYTGTHDNDTMQGWLNNASKEEVELVRRYLTGNASGCTIKDEGLCPALIREAMASTARFAVFPLQDLFAIGSEGRMNTPSTTGGHNWQWRMKTEHFDETRAQWLKELSALYGRNINS